MIHFLDEAWIGTSYHAPCVGIPYFCHIAAKNEWNP
jgi:hypothetical protein